MIPAIAVLLAAYTIPRLLIAAMQYGATEGTKRWVGIVGLLAGVGSLGILFALVRVLSLGTDVTGRLP